MKKGKLGLLVVSLLTLSGLAGCAGAEGPAGLDGKSAYDLAVAAGFEGTLEEWLAALKGDKGDKGETGAPGLPGENGKDGEDGEDGAAGKSAYEIAKENGFEGTEEEWLASLKGADGKNGTNGTNGEDGEDGAAGKSAYELYLASLEEGEEPLSLEEWLASLAGADGEDGTDGQNGADGVSVEDVAVDHVFKGGKEYLVYTITLSDGTVFTKEVLVDEGDFTTYSKYGFDSENHLLMTNDEHKAPYMIASEEAFVGSVLLDGNDLTPTNKYVQVIEGEGTYKIGWDEEAQVWKSNNQKKNSTSASITFVAQTTGILRINLRAGGESNYDYTNVTLNGATMTEGMREQTISNITYPFSSKGLGDDTDYTHAFSVRAGDTITYTFSKDSSGERNMDGVKIKSVAFESDAIAPSLDAVTVVNFNSNGGSAVAPKAYKIGAKLGDLPKPEKNGVAFDGWFLDSELENPVTADTVAEEGMILYAAYTDPVYVILNVDGEFDVKLAPKGKAFSIDDLEAPAGFGFKGWHTDANLDADDNYFANGTVLEEDITLYGGFEELIGYSAEKPYVVESIGEGATVNIKTKDAEGYGHEYFVKYVAEEDGFITLRFRDEVKLSGNGYVTPKAEFYKVEEGVATKIGDTSSGSRSASQDIKDVAVLISGSDSLTKLKVAEGDEILVKYTLNALGTAFGKAALDLNKLDPVNHEDNTLAAEFEADTVVNFVKPSDKLLTWYKFTPETDGAYWLSVGDGAGENDYTYVAVGTIAENGDSKTYTSLASNVSGTGSVQGGKRLDLTAGTTYYFSVTSSYANKTMGFKLSSTLPVGSDALSPLALTMDGDPVPATYYGSYHYSSFTVAEDGIYEIASTYSSASPALYSAATFTGTAVTLKDMTEKGDFAVAKYATLTAGTYYLRVSNSSSANQSIAVRHLAEGTTIETAKAFTWADEMPVETGVIYKYKETGDTFRTNVVVPAGAKAEFFKVTSSYSYETYSYVYSRTAIATIDATDSEEEVSAPVKVTKNEEAYVLVTAEAESVTLRKAAYVGPLSGAPFVTNQVQFNGNRNGSSYYFCKFTEDGYYWDSTALKDIASVSVNNGIYTILTDTGNIIITDGVDLVMIEGSHFYFLTSRNSYYGSSYSTYYAGRCIKTSTFDAETGTAVAQILTDAEHGEDGVAKYIYVVYKDGQIYFDVPAPEFAQGENINDAGAQFDMVLGGERVGFTVSNNYNASDRTITVGEPHITPADPEPDTPDNMYALDIAISEENGFATEYAGAGALTYVYAFGDNNAEHWYAVESGRVEIDTSLYHTFIVVRMNPECGENPGWDYKWAQTDNIVIDTTKTSLTLTGYDGINHMSYSY